MNGLRKVAQLELLTRGGAQTLGQAALKYILAEPTAMSCLPNIYDSAQLREFAAASDQPDLTETELAEVARLYRDNFGVDEEPMRFKGLDPESDEGRHTLAETRYSSALA